MIEYVRNVVWTSSVCCILGDSQCFLHQILQARDCTVERS